MEPSTPTSSIPSQGPIVGIIIILIVLVIGAFFFFRTLSMNAAPSPSIVSTTTQETAAALVATSDEMAAIASDLEAENVDDLDAELTTPDAETR